LTVVAFVLAILSFLLSAILLLLLRKNLSSNFSDCVIEMMKVQNRLFDIIFEPKVEINERAPPIEDFITHRDAVGPVGLITVDEEDEVEDLEVESFSDNDEYEAEKALLDRGAVRAYS